MVERDGSSGVVVGWRLGEILVGLFGTDAVTPVGAAVPSSRVSDIPLPSHGPSRTGGNPRPCPVAASLSSRSFLKVLLGMRRFVVLGAWWNPSAGAAVASHLRFR